MSKRNRSTKGKHARDKQDDGEKGAFAHKILSEAQTKELLELTVAEVETKMIEIMKMEDHEVDLKASAIVDYYTGGFWWAKEQGFTAQQTSGFFTLIHTLLENIKDKHMTLVDNVKQFKKMFAGIGQEVPEIYGGMEFFDLNQAKVVADFINTCLFQHYALYEFVFGCSQAEEIIGTDLEIEVPKAANMPWPPPLDEGISDAVYKSYIATPPSSPTPESTKEEEVVTTTSEDTKTAEEKEAEFFSSLNPEEIKRILDSVCKEVLSGVEADIASKLRDKEIAFVNRINKIHKVGD